MTHVPYKGGGPAASDLLGNHIPLIVLPVSTVMEEVHKGNAKLIAVVFPRRLPSLPNVPTVSESLPGFSSAGSWIGIFGPAALPQPIANRFQAAAAQILSVPETRERLEAVGQFVVANTPRELAEQIDRSMALYWKLVKTAGIQPE